MSRDLLYKELVKICGLKKVSYDPEVLKNYSSDMSYIEGNLPKYITWPRKTQHIEKIIKLANRMNFSIIPISSSTKIKQNGDTIPRNNNCIIVNLSQMKKIFSIDRKNRVVMVEPGVTFKELIPKLKQKGLRLLMPLYPTKNKSVLSSALEREPITIPRYHWDSSDPLLCTEVIFGTGDLFRTGTAAGPGTLKQQKRMGIANVNPMGPTQFSPFRIIQGAQGSLGVVTWATIKLELLPSVQKVFHLQSENIHELLDIQYELIKYRLCDELFILNNLALASLLKSSSEDIDSLSNSLTKWNLIYVISGRGKLADDKIEYLEGDINEILKEKTLRNLKTQKLIRDDEILKIISDPSKTPWKMRYKGGSKNIFFVSQFERIAEYISLVEKNFSKDLGIYIQPINQGTSYHCEFDLFYNPDNSREVSNIKNKFLDISITLMENGAFFNRPYGLWAKEVFNKHSDQTQIALKKVKKIFDPNNIMNPGVLCFDD
jgi:hypothetical protein